MQIRFLMYPGELQLAPVYRRVFPFPESRRATVLKGLIAFSHEAGCLPRWFLSLPEMDYLNQRSQTCRITLSSKHLEYGAFYQEMSPLSGPMRVYRIKELLTSAISGSSKPMRITNPNPNPKLNALSLNSSTALTETHHGGDGIGAHMALNPASNSTSTDFMEMNVQPILTPLSTSTSTPTSITPSKAEICHKAFSQFTSPRSKTTSS